jgi:hypothetical protein
MDIRIGGNVLSVPQIGTKGSRAEGVQLDGVFQASQELLFRPKAYLSFAACYLSI